MPIASHIFGSLSSGYFGISCGNGDISILVAFTLASDTFPFTDILLAIPRE